ncbi:hypothetical protein IFM89_036588 [Coptis chinensis]|uniref:MBD domain-containing protein n=1 Tax=Coptis chinensis TaxID=261450 RepID=A0A835LLG1_9MAGN|nr:hypothetical protein IFM89_036588 [Coptis chinensis]
MDLAVVLDPEKNPDWLPPDWKVVTRTRPNGKSAGTKDTYYYEPIKNRQFRSKREVLEYIAGKTSARSHKKSKNNEETASSLSMKSSQPIKVDLDSPPEKVKWVLGNSSGISWMPFIGDEWVPEHIKLGWAEMFNQA